LDLACGRFGDFFKYCRHGASKLVGMDISPDNIFDIEKGAAVRVLKSISQNQNCRPLVSNTMMLLGDCSKNLSSNEAGLNDLNKYYIDVLYGRIKPKHGKLSRMSGVGVNGFDLVVCNLAIHYMMNDYDSLHNFLQNVKENLVHKGYFIGSCLDGEEIVKALKDDSKIEGYYKSSSSSKKSKSKSSKSSKSNKLIWSIEKVDKSKKLFEEDFIGQRIRAYMDTFYEPTEENLVHIDFLAEEALNYNLKLVDTKLFIDKQDNLFNDYKKERSDFHKKIEGNEAIKQWISFHRWFIFQKID
jgi:SAM-dependent methyltransferase